MDLVPHCSFTLLDRHGELDAGFSGHGRDGGLRSHFTEGATTDRPWSSSPTWSSSSPPRREYFQY